MRHDILPLLEAWDGNGVVFRHDQPTQTWILIALHSSALGPPTGGTRMKVYSDLPSALRDAMRLAEGMTYKWAGLDMAFGGGKAVMALGRPLDRREQRGLMRRYGELLESLGGAFYTGADLGTGPDDMSHVAERTRYVLGLDPQTGRATDPGPHTARGVLAGIRSAVRERLGRDELTGTRVLIQGLGGVGRPLARRLQDAGAELLLADLDENLARSLAEELGATAVPSDRVYDEPCDVFSPCAVGGVLNEQTIPSLRCRIVAGSANNQLLEEDDADRLAKWEILYVPDYIVNAGGAMAFSLMSQGVEDSDEIGRRVDGIGGSVTTILGEAERATITPLAAARQRVDRLVALHRQRVDDVDGVDDVGAQGGADAESKTGPAAVRREPETAWAGGSSK